MELKDYTFEDIEDEYLRRKKAIRDARESERLKVKRCRSCVYLGTVDAYGKNIEAIDPIKPYHTVYCPFVRMKRPMKQRTNKVVPIT